MYFNEIVGHYRLVCNSLRIPICAAFLRFKRIIQNVKFIQKINDSSKVFILLRLLVVQLGNSTLKIIVRRTTARRVNYTYVDIVFDPNFLFPTGKNASSRVAAARNCWVVEYLVEQSWDLIFCAEYSSTWRELRSCLTIRENSDIHTVHLSFLSTSI